MQPENKQQKAQISIGFEEELKEQHRQLRKQMNTIELAERTAKEISKNI